LPLTGEREAAVLTTDESARSGTVRTRLQLDGLRMLKRTSTSPWTVSTDQIAVTRGCG